MRKLIKYIEILKEWNKKINLVSFKENKIWKEVVEESKKFIPYAKGRVIDIGTGAGIPGIVVKILKEDIEMYLCESRRKKAFFLEEVVKELKLKDVVVLNRNFLELKEYEKFFDRVFSRGLGIDKVKKAKYLLVYNGKIVVYKKGDFTPSSWKRDGDLLIWEKL
ncbi:MAG: 16S rRNA (guanine(527)-N(7))-methyltransferase RsmG [Caldiserica bacterium]|nr:MAG: 16S rRNA (guanine(527)-N(7))-methyltransferase RsmG [Caldisericota bacterium]